MSKPRSRATNRNRVDSHVRGSFILTHSHTSAAQQRTLFKRHLKKRKRKVFIRLTYFWLAVCTFKHGSFVKHWAILICSMLASNHQIEHGKQEKQFHLRKSWYVQIPTDFHIAFQYSKTDKSLIVPFLSHTSVHHPVATHRHTISVGSGRIGCLKRKAVPSGKELHKTMERSTMLSMGKSTNFLWPFSTAMLINQLFLWPFSIANCECLPEGILAHFWQIRDMFSVFLGVPRSFRQTQWVNSFHMARASSHSRVHKLFCWTCKLVNQDYRLNNLNRANKLQVGVNHLWMPGN